MRPLLVKELAEIFILDHNRKPFFNKGDRLNVLESVLEYLSSLVTTAKEHTIRSERTVVRLAHFLIKEYLISPCIAQGLAMYFFTTETEAHQHISLSCLAYYLHQSAIILVTEEQYKHFTL